MEPFPGRPGTPTNAGAPITLTVMLIKCSVSIFFGIAVFSWGPQNAAHHMPTRRVLTLLTEDGSLALGVTAESAQDIARLLERAALEMRLAS